MRFVALLDVLGFKDRIDAGELQEVKQTVDQAAAAASYALSLGHWPPESVDPNVSPSVRLRKPRLHHLAFGDSYVIFSDDDSIMCFFETVVATAVFSLTLFGARLGVRGAVVCGEAERAGSGTQLIGRAVNRADRLQKEQDWYGVILDPDMLTDERRAILKQAAVAPLVVDYEVPLKPGSILVNPLTVINWRLNLSVESGIASLFPLSADINKKAKRDNTLNFCQWLRKNGRSHVRVEGKNGKRVRIPWLTGMHVGSHAPGTSEAVNGDEF